MRDRIPEIIKVDGKSPITRILPEDEYLQELDTKLNEEVVTAYVPNQGGVDNL